MRYDPAMDSQPLERVGVRELRRHFGAYLDRVRAGRTLAVTRRGVDVALLVPVAREASSIERLIAEGRARRGKGSLADLGLPPPAGGEPLSETLRHLRDEEER